MLQTHNKTSIYQKTEILGALTLGGVRDQSDFLKQLKNFTSHMGKKKF